MEINLIYKKKILSPKTSSKKIREQFIRIAEMISKGEKKIFNELNVVFCGDSFIRNYNRKYLGHDFETDIITFHYDVNKNKGAEGELLISADALKRNSDLYKVSFKNEMLRVYIHGLLHLCGYNDITETERKIMKRKENFYLKKI